MARLATELRAAATAIDAYILSKKKAKAQADEPDTDEDAEDSGNSPKRG